ncbi:MAG: UDP-N-acetylmuramoyl-L-alanyl-D-glutamate--2,6-diaminopimelate ligase [Candidatus Peregrinibacteria bacterium Greene0416_62]|nr:MAG: UDP-N-acetylmuramoyl-L-alanyl-D-glutamate--2,6-diaminopimelate ligase [Candidatus Peregrinibacteria bacterium Greene0416_62]
MREKRPEIGRICSKLADMVIATEDETYSEDPHAVLEEVWAGVDQDICKAHKIFDRREAIAFALKTAKPGDAVVFCGMGPFSTMTKLEGRIEWDERKIVREELKKLGYTIIPNAL